MNKVCIEMMNGKKMRINLYADMAPISVANFLHLVRNNYYDGIIFHRVIKGFMSQCGQFYTANAEGGLGAKNCPYSIPGEFAENGFENEISHDAGVISMARTNDPNSAGGQFFLCSSNAKFLDGKYAAFGRAADALSLQVMEEINSISTSDIGSGLTDFPNGATVEDITIKHIYII